MIRNVIFDLDGTLLDTREGIVESAAYAAARLGYRALPYDTLLKFVGPPIQQSFISFYGCDEGSAQEAANVFREYYRTQALLKAKPYDGIYELCGSLKEQGVRMAVATYKREDYALTLLRHFGFDKYCDPIHGADNNNVLKKENIVHMCQKEMGADNADSVLVGDTEHDAKGAFNSATPFIAVTYGFGFKCREDVGKYPCMGIADSPADIGKIILADCKTADTSPKPEKL